MKDHGSQRSLKPGSKTCLEESWGIGTVFFDVDDFSKETLGFLLIGVKQGMTLYFEECTVSLCSFDHGPRSIT